MTRIPPAARALISEAQAYDQDVSAEAHGEPDGYGVHREIAFDSASSQWLRPVLEVIAEDDYRIANLSGSTKHLVVEFVGDPRADMTRERFGIDSIARIFREEAEPADEDEDETDDDDGEDETDESSRTFSQ